MQPFSQLPPLFDSCLTNLKRVHQGKVRDIYEVDADHLLIVATDRLSAFDVVLPDPIPCKGEVLTRISSFWFGKTAHLAPNHLSNVRVNDVIGGIAERAQLAGRAMVVKKLSPLPIEAVARGYLIGSGFRDYLAHGRLCGIDLPPGIEMAQRLPAPLFTPAYKAPAGQHDANIDFEAMTKLVGLEFATSIKRITLEIYEYASKFAYPRSVIIADTKLEFGVDRAGRLTLMDELLTPDSSRFWPISSYRAGISPPSFDKQFVRDYLESLHWNKKPPAPHLPREVLTRTSESYREALRLLTESAA